MKTYALSGVIGAIAFMTGDCLIYCYKGNTGADIDPMWAGVGEWRFVLSACLGFLGMALMLPAAYSFFCMIRKLYGKFMQTLAALMVVGAASTGFLHFALGSLLPITYKAVLSVGGGEETARAVCEHWSDVLAAPDAVLIGCLLLEYVLHLIVTVSGRSGLPRLLFLAGPVGALAIGAAWKLSFAGTAAEGAYGAWESMAEGLVFLTVYFYWKKESKQEKENEGA